MPDVAPGRPAFALAFVVGAVCVSVGFGVGAVRLRYAWSVPAAGGSGSSDIAAKRAKAAEVRAALARQRERLAAGIARSGQLGAELSRTRAQAGAESARLARLERALARRQRHLNGYAVHTYRDGDSDTLAMLLGATSFEDFITRYRYATAIGEEAAETIVWIKGARVESGHLRRALAARSTRLAGLVSRSDRERAAIRADIETQRRTLAKLGADVTRLLAAQERAGAASAGKTTTPRYDGPTGGGDWASAASLAPGAYATVEGRAGRYLIPAAVPGSYRSTGVRWQAEASRYSVAENGTGTSSGRPLDDGELTCAHKTLPLGTLIAVSSGGRHVIVLVTDRGPFSPPGRDIDLTLAAAGALGMDGTRQVTEEVVTPAR